jgi:hypothetical protein
MNRRRDSHPRRGPGRPYRKQPGHGGHPEEVESNSGHSVGQTWGALKRCWRGYHIARKDDDYDRIELYARRIRKLQYELGIAVSEFPDIDLFGDFNFDEWDCD